MTRDPTHFVPRLKTHRPGIRDLAVELLVLTFSLLHGQDIARCMRVCRYFAGLIRSEPYLQYKIELAQTGMVDGDSSMLLVSERRQRLHQYYFNFRNGIFDYETPDAAHPDYAHQFRNLAWNHGRRAYVSASALYGTFLGSRFFLSVFNHDRAQDLLVIIKQVTTDMNTGRFLEVCFWSLGGSKTTRMDHPAAAQSSIQLFPPSGSDPTAKIDVLTLKIEAHYVIWVLCITEAEAHAESHSVEVFNWKTGQVVSRIEFGSSLVNVALWGDSHLLVQPADSESPQCLDIYSLTPSSPPRPLRRLQLLEPTLNHGESVVFHPMQTSLDPSPPEGHFHADPAHSMVILTYHIHRSNRDEYASHLLIPYSTLRAHIDAAFTVVDTPDSDSQHVPLEPVPWQDWGPHGTARAHSDSGWPSLGLRVEGQRKIVEDVEAALPGVVDPECAAIPYVVYRFQLPVFPWEYPIRVVQMSMTGFTVTYRGTDLREMERTWTV
ncbi:hypothetical protein V8D89_009420 [Ganoderma adspersum]